MMKNCVTTLFVLISSVYSFSDNLYYPSEKHHLASPPHTPNKDHHPSTDEIMTVQLSNSLLDSRPNRNLPPPADMVQVDVFTSSEGDYHCFRTPSLLYTSNGTLLAFAEGRGRHTGSCSDLGDVVIVVKRSNDDGMTWGPLSIVHSEYPRLQLV